MDELAHSNALGSRHPKRWQDIEELLEAGIDVFTTVNVQHLESLNDVVSGVTGIQVRETVPDPFLMPPMKSYWSICRPTICANGSTKVKCISPVRRNALLNIFPQGQSDRPPRAGATPDSRSRRRSDARRRAHPGEEKYGIPAMRFYCVSGITPAAKNWCVPRRVWPPGSAASGTPSMSKRQRYTAYRKNNVGPF